MFYCSVKDHRTFPSEKSLNALSVQQHLFDDRCLMTVRDEGEGRNGLDDDQIGLLADCDRAEDVAHAHCVCGIDGAGIE